VPADENQLPIAACDTVGIDPEEVVIVEAPLYEIPKLLA
jgi:hypothetical protein